MVTLDYAFLFPAFCVLSFVILALGALTGYARFLPGQGAYVSIVAVLAGFILFWPMAADLLANGPLETSFLWFQAGPVTITTGMNLDPLSVSMLGLVVTVALCVQVYSLGYMHGEEHFTWYYAAHSLFTAAMLGLILADNYLLLYIAWELVGLCSYLLIGFYYERRSAANAAKKAFITTRLGDVGLLIGILLLFRATGTFQMSGIFAAVEQGAIDPGTMSWAAFFLFLGAMGKSAQFPLHVWLPDAMEGPTPVSALIHAATMVAAGVYLVGRSYPLFEAAPGVLAIVTVIGTITTLLGAGIALVVTDIKRVIAYSTVSKLGLMMMALGAGGAGLTAAIFYLITHGFFKALLFLGAGAIIHGTGRQDLDQLYGLRRHMPVTAWVLLIASLALAGIPPLSGFWSKDEVMLALSANPAVFALALLSIFLSSVYTGRLWLRLFLDNPPPPAPARRQPIGHIESHEHEHHPHEAPPVMAIPMAILAVLSVISGFVALPAIGSALGLPGGWGDFLYHGHPHHYEFNLVIAAISTITAVGGLAVAAGFWWFRIWSPVTVRQRFAGLHRLLLNKFYLDEVYQTLVDYVVLAFGRFIAWFDRVFVNDIGVNGTGRIAVVAGEVLKYTETGRLPNYALAMALGLIICVVFAWTFVF